MQQLGNQQQPQQLTQLAPVDPLIAVTTATDSSCLNNNNINSANNSVIVILNPATSNFYTTANAAAAPPIQVTANPLVGLGKEVTKSVKTPH